MSEQRRDDLKPAKRTELKWDTGSAEQSLNTLFTEAEQHALQAIDWYLNAKRQKKRAAQGLRIGAIAVTAAAGILPMLSQVLLDGTQQPIIAPVWASVALAVAALLVAIDHFFGFSSGWMRFITTEHQIRQLLHEFQMDHDVERATWQGQPPSAEQVQRVLLRCKAFLTQVNDIIRKETEQWVAEFQSALRQIDDAARAKADLPEQGGGINLTVDNGDQAEGGWTVTLDQGTARNCSGKQAAFANLTPGVHLLTVEGKIGGATIPAEQSVVVAAGRIVDVKLSLS